MISDDLMLRLHGANVYAGFVPTFAEDLQGWNSEAAIFAELVSQGRYRTIVDVGVWKGGSTVVLAELLRSHGVDGAVIAVDTFLGSVEHWDRSTVLFDLIPRRHGSPLLYEQFLSNIVRRGLQDYVVPVPLTSDAAAALLNHAGIRPDIVHVDAAHDYESVKRDARAYWEILGPGGALIGDDYHETWPGVIRAANEFSAEVGYPLTVSGPKWVLHKN